jgi:hypothetical protein
MEDNHSVASGSSTLSSTQVKIECPHCKNDYQMRSMFNHIFTKHFRDFKRNISGAWLKEANPDEPLRIFWDVTDDFDEVKETELFVCLASKKTFVTTNRAIAHFKKNPEIYKQHKKEVRQLLKDVQSDNKKEIKEHLTNPVRSKYIEAKKNKDPILIKALWSSILYYRNTIDFILSHYRGKLEPTYTIYWVEGATDKQITLSNFLERYDNVTEMITNEYTNKSTNVEHLIKLEAFLFNYFWIQVRQNFGSTDEIYREEKGEKPVAFPCLHISIFERKKFHQTNSLDDFIDTLPEPVF